MGAQTLELIETGTAIGLENSIIVYNDYVNIFEHVIDSFIDVLKHSPEQAEQCTWIIHSKGKCKVKQGEYDLLLPLCSAILDRGISAEIN